MAQLAPEIATLPVARLPALPQIGWRALLWFCALTIVVAIAAASYLAYTGSLATTSYNIQRLQSEREQWRNRNERLRLELAKVESLAWIEHEAVGRLKMQRPPQIIYLNVSPQSQSAARSDSTSSSAQ